MEIKTIEWHGTYKDGNAIIIDQTKLPNKYETLIVDNIEIMWDAIRKLKIRGAPAIGIAAAYGLFLETRNIKSKDIFFEEFTKASKYLNSSRPTAVNLSWALKRMEKKARSLYDTNDLDSLKEKLWQEANNILKEDMEICHKLGENGQTLVKNNSNLLTHCNAGGLATSGYGTALAVMFSATKHGKKIHVYADETRPLWQGARLTTWELKQCGIPTTLICDNTAAFLMQQNKIDIIFTGADRIAANGDTANKIGTYSLSILANAHQIPFYIVAPVSTFDFNISSGKEIKIEERSGDEVTKPYNLNIAPEGINIYSPAFDVTPAKYISGIVTEFGIIHQPVTKEKIYELCCQAVRDDFSII